MTLRVFKNYKFLFNRNDISGKSDILEFPSPHFSVYKSSVFRRFITMRCNQNSVSTLTVYCEDLEFSDCVDSESKFNSQKNLIAL